MPFIIEYNDDKSHQMTTWVNDNDVKAEFLLMMDEKKASKHTMINGTQWLKVVIEPGEKKTLSSKYDRAIRTEDVHGRVIAGLCPWLKKEGEGKVDIAECLDYKEIARQTEIKELAAKIKDEASLKEAYETVQRQTVEKADAVTKRVGRPAKAKE